MKLPFGNLNSGPDLPSHTPQVLILVKWSCGG